MVSGARITRRQFLKSLGVTGFLSLVNWEKLIAKAFNEVKIGNINLVWFEAQDCAGDTTSLIQASNPDIVELLLGLTRFASAGEIAIPFHETLMPEWGLGSLAHLILAIGGAYDPFVLVLEGAIPPDEKLLGAKGSDTLCYIGDYESVMESLEKLRKLLRNPERIEDYLPSLKIVRSLSAASARRIVSRIEERFDEIEKSTEECMHGLESEDVVSCARWFACLMRRAVAVVALGNCACYGGVVGNTVAFSWYDSEPLKSYRRVSGFDLYEEWGKRGWSFSPSGGVGFFPDPIRGYEGFAKILLKSASEPFASAARPYVEFINGRCKPLKPSPKAECKPAIAVPGCPSNGNAQLRVLANLILWIKGELPLPELDKYWRPIYIYGNTTHSQCPRKSSYDAGFLRSIPGEPDRGCLFAVGCKGPIASCPWNRVGWIEGEGGPTRVGGICIACTEPGFMDAYEPFYKPLPSPSKSAFVRLAKYVAAPLALGAGMAFLSAYTARKSSRGES